MILLPRTMRIDLPSLPCGWLGAFVLVVGVIACNLSSLQASILLPESPQFHLDSMSLDDTSGGSSADDVPEEDERDAPSKLLAGTDAAPSSSSSGGSSSAGGCGGSTLSAIDDVSGSMPSDIQLAGWVTSLIRFALPMPPGTDLLRPPQTV